MQKNTEENADIIPERLVDAVFGVLEGILLDIDEQPTIEAVPRWIPCEERLPEKEDSYLVTLRWEREPTEVDTDVLWYSPARGRGFDPINAFTVTAWMPLPEPYKGEREDDEER